MEKQHNPNDWVVKVVCSSDNETKMETISVYGGSEDDLMLIHQQIKPHFMLNRESAKTFVDRFLDNFNMATPLPKRIDQFEHIVENGSSFVYFINDVSLRRLDILGKFFFFLLKKIFLTGKASPIEEIKCILRYYEKKGTSGKP